jgi:hypothetical protein
MDWPIVCTLSEAELRLRREEILDGVKTAAISTTELSNGYAYEFPASAEIMMMLGRLVALEHECCRFLSFKISLEAGKTTAILEVTGRVEAKPVIANFLGGSV